MDDVGGRRSGHQVAPEVVTVVIFAFSDLENHRRKKLESFGSLLSDLIIFGIYLLEDELLKIHFPRQDLLKMI